MGSKNKDVDRVNDFEFMDDIWVGETYIFTEWLQLQKEPTVTRSISISLTDIPDDIQERVLKKLGLDIKKGMDTEEVVAIFGQPIKTETFTEDQKTYEYVTGDKEKYYLSLTIQNEGGLIYVVLMNHTKTIQTLTKH